MAAIIWQDVQALAPELSVTNATARIYILSYVNAAINVGLLDGENGPTTRLARIYFAAHLGTTIGTAAAGGALIGESEGGLSSSYAAPKIDRALLLTWYGRQYLGLVDTSLARLPFLV